MPKDPSAVVCIVDVTRKYAHLKPYKGFGPSTIPSELLKQLARVMARLYDAVTVEATLGLSPPLQWRGADMTMIVSVGWSVGSDPQRDA